MTEVQDSPQDFDEYQRLKRLATQALFVEELSNDSLADIEGARMDDRHAALDRLMDD